MLQERFYEFCGVLSATQKFAALRRYKTALARAAFVEPFGLLLPGRSDCVQILRPYWLRFGYYLYSAPSGNRPPPLIKLNWPYSMRSAQNLHV
jgi:hypothetical protein